MFRTEASLTTAFLSEVLEAEVAACTSVRVGTGLVGMNLRLGLTYAPGSSPDLPATLVAKLPSPDELSRTTGIQMGNYEREVRFYQELAGTVAIRSPRCFFAEVDLATGDFLLLLEDLAPACPGDQIAGCDVEAARLAMREAARLHAPRWGDPTLGDLPYLSRRDTSRTAQLELLYQAVLPGFLAEYGRHLTPDGVALVERLGTRLGPWLEGSPLVCVTHGDYRLDNMLFATPAGGHPLTTVDWQTVGHGPPTADVSYFLGAGLLPDVRRATERDLVGEYHDELGRLGITGYDFASCWDDFVRYTFSGVLMSVIASMIVQADERGVAMFTAMATRHVAHALDLGAGELL